MACSVFPGVESKREQRTRDRSFRVRGPRELANAREYQAKRRAKARAGKEPRPVRSLGKVPNDWRYGAERVPQYKCRFCCGMSWCREREGCPLGPVGCGLPFADELIR